MSKEQKGGKGGKGGGRQGPWQETRPPIRFDFKLSKSSPHVYFA